MHELRKDPITNRWVIVLSESKKPEEYVISKDEPKESECIFCAGREKETPPEIMSIRDNSQPNTPGWSVRVLPEINPLLQVEGSMERKGVGMYDKMNSIGANELVIESPKHNQTPEDMGVEQITKIISAHKSRILDLEKDSRLRQIIIFKNSGRKAGAISSHPHSQIVATPVIPKNIKEELDIAKSYYAYKERCIFCDIIREEIRIGQRVILETKNFIAFCPYAPRFPFQFWIIPKRHNCEFQSINEEEIRELSLTMLTTFKNMSRTLQNPPYNYILHTAPNRVPRHNHWHTLGEDYHWHIEVIPRITSVSGFEWGAGFYVIPTSPENAAKFLREG